jgi:two-component system sporulation sensor kinase C
LAKTPTGRRAISALVGTGRRIADLELALEGLKGTEDALLRCAGLAWQFYDGIPIPCMSLDAAGRIVRVNSTWLQLLGYAHPEVTGHRFTDFLMAESRPTFRRELRRLRSGRDVRGVELTIRRPNGPPLTAACDGRYVHDGPVGGKHIHFILRERDGGANGPAGLRLVEGELLEVLGALHDGVNIIGSNREMLYVNPVCEKIYGPWVGKKCYEFFRGRRSACRPCLISGVADGVTTRRETDCARSNRAYEVIDAPIRTRGGKIAVLEVARDVTARKHAETALWRERRAFQAVAEAALRSTDVAGLCKHALVSLAEILGFERGVIRLHDKRLGMLNVTVTTGLSAEEVASGVPDHRIDDERFVASHVARTRRPVFAPDVRRHPIYKKCRRRFRETGVRSIISWPIGSSDGDLLGVVHLISHTPMEIPASDRAFFEAIAGMFGIALDRKIGEQALEVSEKIYRSRFENSPIALWEEDFSEVKSRIDSLRSSGVTDLKAYLGSRPQEVLEFAGMVRLTDANRASLELYEADSIEELSDLLIENIKRWTLDQFWGVLVGIANGLTCFEMEYTTKTARGEERYLQVKWAAAPGYEDDLSRVRVSVVDLTRRRRAEDALRLAEAQIRLYSRDLEKAVAERTARIRVLERQRSESEKLAATGRMAARVAHEINNPLAGIKNSFQLLKQTMNREHPYFPYAARLEKEIDRIAGIVRRMFDLYHHDGIKVVEVPVGETITGVVAILENACRASGIEIKVSVPDHSVTTCLPEGYLNQILFNLIQNSLEASGPGDVVEVGMSVGQGRLSITVSDRGKGIDPPIAHRVFEPFFTTKDGSTSSGLGLGLSVSKGMVEATGGALTFESKATGGTVFTVSLPIKAAESGAQD